MHILLTVGSENAYTFNETPWQAGGFCFGGPMRAIVRRPDGSRDRRSCDNYGCRKVLRTWSRRRCQRDGFADRSNYRGKLLDRTTVRLKLLRLLMNPSGWPGLLGQKCTVLRCDAGNWRKLVRQVGGIAHHRFSMYLRCLNEK